MEKYYDDDSVTEGGDMAEYDMGGYGWAPVAETKPAALKDSWLTEQNITMGEAGRTLTIAEIMGALNEFLSSDKVTKVEISPLQKPILWDGSPLTGGTLQDTDLVSAYNKDRDYSRRIQANSVNTLFSTIQSTSLYIHKYNAFKDRTNDNCSYLFCDKYSLILVGPEAKDTKDVILIEPSKLRSNDINVQFPYNFAFLIYAERPDLFETYKDKFSFTDRKGFEIELRKALNILADQTVNLPDGTNALAEVEPEKAHEKPSDIQSLKQRLETIRPEIEAGVEALRAQLATPDASVIQISSNFVKDLPLIAETLTQIISRDQRQSVVGEIALRHDIAEVANLTSDNLNGLFFDQQIELKIAQLRREIDAYKPSFWEKLMIRFGGQSKKIALQTELRTEEQAYKAKREQEQKRVSEKVNGLLTTTQSFQEAAINRGAIIESQDAICTATIDLLTKASEIMGQIMADFDKTDKRYGFLARRVNQFSEKIEGIHKQQAINGRLMDFELTNTEDMDTLASALVAQLQITTINDTAARSANNAEIGRQTSKLGRDLFEQTKSILKDFDDALKLREAQRQAVLQASPAFSLSLEDKSGQTSGVPLETGLQQPISAPRQTPQ